jgi:hypothetical protein
MVDPFKFIWAGIIAASQVVNAVKAYLPWGERLKPLATMSMGLQYISLDAEDSWSATLLRKVMVRA